jgi:[NiFe] hydrogenase large subunit
MQTSKVVIDPITRIEGHLKIEVQVTEGKITDAWCSGTLFRGIETILMNRSPEDAWLFTQRLCGVCTYVHGETSVRAVENAAGLTIPANARIVRNLLMGGQYLHDHPVHFYHLCALDWVDVVSALQADPSDTESLAKEISPNAPAIDFAAVKAKLQTFVDSGQLGIFAGGYWGHSAYILEAEENLLFAAHYLHALREQVDIARMHAIFGAKNPHLQSLRVGGVTCHREINGSRISLFRSLLSATREFINTIYLPDVRYLATKYQDWGRQGGSQNYMSFGEFPLGTNEPTDLFLERGIIFNRNISSVQDIDLPKITEHVARSWYSGATALHPASGETAPNYTGYDPDARYSWLKAPRYNGEPMEVGPLARVLVAYGRRNRFVVPAVDDFLGKTGLTANDLHSTLGRIAARAIETQVIADTMEGWLNRLASGQSTYTRASIPATASGCGLNEAPRGALGHWISISKGKIGNYQMVVPSTWNLGPRCADGKRGPVEAALIGTRVEDPAKPVEVLRTVHSFDPCLACAVHVIDTHADQIYSVKVV